MGENERNKRKYNVENGLNRLFGLIKIFHNKRGNGDKENQKYSLDIERGGGEKRNQQ